MRNFTGTDLIDLRLINTALSAPRFRTAAEAVSTLGAVQCQDLTMAEWGLSLRVPGSTLESIAQESDQGDILRIHVMRPTWHFVAREDIRWLVGLNSPRLKASVRAGNRRIGLDEKVLRAANSALQKALRDGNYLTRQEVKTSLDHAGIPTGVQILAHILAWAEMEGLVCSGPRKGKQTTYALLEERAPQAGVPDREEALARLARRYFGSHGPALAEDFAWWSGQSLADAKEALALVRSDFEQVTLDGKTYWSAGFQKPALQPPAALLLSLFDEYVVAYQNRRHISEEDILLRMFQSGAAVTNLIVIRGRVAGTWRRRISRSSVMIALHPHRSLSPVEREALQQEAVRFGEFIGLSPVLES